MKFRVWKNGAWQTVDIVPTGSTGGSFSGLLSDLSIDANKAWGGYQITGIGPISTAGNIDMGSTYKVVYLAEPTASGDSATKGYVDAAVGTNWGQTNSTRTLIPSTDAIYYLGLASTQYASIFGKYLYGQLGTLTNLLTSYSSTTISTSANLIPQTNNTYKLGNSTNGWADSWFAGNLYGNTIQAGSLLAVDNISGYNTTSIAISADINLGSTHGVTANTLIATSLASFDNLSGYNSSTITMTAAIDMQNTYAIRGMMAVPTSYNSVSRPIDGTDIQNTTGKPILVEISVRGNTTVTTGVISIIGYRGNAVSTDVEVIHNMGTWITISTVTAAPYTAISYIVPVGWYHAATCTVYPATTSAQLNTWYETTIG